MSQEVDQAASEYGLLASGSSGLWGIDVDESLLRDEWCIDLDGPQVSLRFQLHNLQLLSDAIQYVRSGLDWHSAHDGECHPNTDELLLGRFGSSSVTLRWDNEDFPRCFLVINPSTDSFFQIVLCEDDLRMLLDSLQQVVNDLPDTDGE